MQKTKSKKLFYLTLLTIFMLLALFLFSCNLRVTKNNYEKIHDGMSFNEVINILGDDYEVSSNAGFGGYSSSCYVWGNENKCITIIFLNGKVFSKAQVGL